MNRKSLPSRRKSTPRRRAVAVAAVMLCVVPTCAAAARRIDIGSRRQVFVDGRFLTAAHGVELRVHPPRKTGGPALQADHPDRTMIGRNGTVLFVDGVYHLWYESFERARESWPAGEVHDEREGFPLDDLPCYARSRDGIRWEKPDNGVSPPYAGAEPNITPVVDEAGAPLKIGGIGQVFTDPNAPAGVRFRMVKREHDRAKGIDWLNLYASADGRKWVRTHRNVMTYATPKHHLDSPNVIFWDDRIGKYVAYVRRGLARTEGVARQRTVARAESADLAHFPNVEVSPIVLQWDTKDPAAIDAATGRHFALIDFYNSAAFKYPWAQDAYYMFPSMYFHFHGEFLREFRDEAPTNAGPIDIRFAASRDGIVWHRHDRGAFVDLGPRGSFDSMLLFMFRGIVPGRHEGEMFLYYTGSDRPHGWDRDLRNKRILRAAGFTPPRETSWLSRLVARRDGFISVRAGHAGGGFTTPVLRFAGAELELNVDTSAAGELRVELQDEWGVPYPGFALADADLIHSTNEVNRHVTWRGRADVSWLAGRPVRIHFSMRDTDLYAFEFGEAARP